MPLSVPPFLRGTCGDRSLPPSRPGRRVFGVTDAETLRRRCVLLDSLSAEQRARTLFALDTDAWRRWSNIHPYLMRHGLPLEEMSGAPRDVMRLNDFIGMITGSHTEYGEWVYWLSVMGTPSADDAWGWQIDGHHLIVNCFVLGDQIVMTPMFMGSEPVAADEGPYAGAAGADAHARAHARAAPAHGHRDRASRRGVHRRLP